MSGRDDDEIKESLNRIKRRLAFGEIDETHYNELREILLGDLSEQERSRYVTGQMTTPPRSAPGPSGRRDSLASSGGLRFVGPSGANGLGVRTQLPRRAQAEVREGDLVLERFRAIEKLGSGGFGVVWLAEDVKAMQQKKRAIKILDSRMVQDEDLLTRFKNEVATMQLLSHAGIVRVFDYYDDASGEEPATLALISMEYVRHGSVQELRRFALDSHKNIPYPVIRSIFFQVLDALAHAHAHEVIHRDVKPANILLAGAEPDQLFKDPTLDPEARLVDFGIAALRQEGFSNGATGEAEESDGPLGSHGFIAPELFEAGCDATPAVDAYGAAATAFWMVTGKPPLAVGHRTLAELAPDIPTDLADVVMAMIEADPLRRLGIRDGLARLQPHRPAGGATAAELARPKDPRLGEERRPRDWGMPKLELEGRAWPPQAPSAGSSPKPDDTGARRFEPGTLPVALPSARLGRDAQAIRGQLNSAMVERDPERVRDLIDELERSLGPLFSRADRSLREARDWLSRVSG